MDFQVVSCEPAEGVVTSATVIDCAGRFLRYGTALIEEMMYKPTHASIQTQSIAFKFALATCNR